MSNIYAASQQGGLLLDGMLYLTFYPDSLAILAIWPNILTIEARSFVF